MALSGVSGFGARRRVVRSFVAMAVALLVLCTPAARGAPPNDNFEDAAVLAGFPVEVEAWVSEATEQPGDRLPGNLTFRGPEPVPLPSVWWRWTAPVDAPVVINVCPPAALSAGSRNGAQVAALVGDRLSALIPVSAGISGEFDSPECPLHTTSARTAFFATAGETYSIVVTTYGQSPMRLEIVPAGFAVLQQVSRNGAPRVRILYRAVPGELDRVEISPYWAPTGRHLQMAPPPPTGLSLFGAFNVAVGSGCEYPRAPFGNAECPIPAGTTAAGPDVRLGDGDDEAFVGYSRADTVVRGGPGDDEINAGGWLSGGPGEDAIKARTWVPSRILGGPGNDNLEGSKRRDTADPGPGMDFVNLKGVTTRNAPGEHIDTRDGDVDHVLCFRKDTLDIDQFDSYTAARSSCRAVRRHGGPARAVPDPNPFSGFAPGVGHTLMLHCPADGPRTCTGTVTLSRGSQVFVRKRFSHRRYSSRFGDSFSVLFGARRAKSQEMTGQLTVTVHSRDRAGKLRTATGVDTFPAVR